MAVRVQCKRKFVANFFHNDRTEKKKNIFISHDLYVSAKFEDAKTIFDPYCRAKYFQQISYMNVMLQAVVQ